MKNKLRWIANLVALGCALLSSVLISFIRLPRGIYLWPLRLVASALAPFTAVAAALAAALGLLTRSPFAVLAGLYASYHSARYTWRVVAFEDGFERAFGPDWAERMPDSCKSKMLRGHWTWNMPAPPRVTHLPDLPFATIPNSSRQLLCDLWLPPAGVERSGLGFIYLHGSAWYLGDKDFGTRVFFRQLAGQGHVVMDVAYRMSPETDLYGMVGDALRAVAWMKSEGAQHGVDPARIVIGGGSAGGHLALMAGYAADDPALRPHELEGLDLSVKGVISIYGVADMTATYFHTNQHARTRDFPHELSPRRSGVADTVLKWLLREDYTRHGLDKPRETAAFLYLLGGHPDEIAETYQRFSPLSHVHPGGPPALLIHGEEDLLVPVEATQQLEARLREAGIPVISLYLPQTDHAYDLVLPRISPPAQSTLYMVERFLALLAAC